MLSLDNRSAELADALLSVEDIDPGLDAPTARVKMTEKTETCHDS